MGVFDTGRSNALKIAFGFAVIVGTAVNSPSSAAEDHEMGEMKTEQSGLKSAADASSTDAYKAAMQSMHSSMMLTYSGDPDRDFLTGMMPHHQGAIEMARVVLQYGKDPQIKALAQRIVDDQSREIAEMKAMLDRLQAPPH